MSQWPGRGWYFAQATQLVRNQGQACVFLLPSPYPAARVTKISPDTQTQLFLKSWHVWSHLCSWRHIDCVYLSLTKMWKWIASRCSLVKKKNTRRNNPRRVYKEPVCLVRARWTHRLLPAAFAGPEYRRFGSTCEGWRALFSNNGWP